MGGSAGLPLLWLLLLLLWSRRGLGASCPNDAYLGPNGKCFPCRTCEGEQEYEKKCSETENAVCKCIRCGECGIGEKRTEEGCQSCPQGTFNDQVNGECRQWTQCPSGKIMTPGTEKKDVVCMPEFKDPEPSPTAQGSDTTEGIVLTASIALITTSVLCLGFLLLFCIFFSLWARKKLSAIFMKQPLKQPAQEVEDCSCRYPEEEEGGGCNAADLKWELLEKIA
ncbi:tumor necrosis factor receptor superfamily member 9 [Eublepharis macularius]|uniref:Tumor necrosis factor receptor superfamily member 9 n=1 Tax=Eublepharis macularius TaxID=481883 RepID=A0AA97KMA1_EUBMA|nr:tumor necrosis factor receptor superfamily member 9 [Eublepharis macularius]